jgi:hypothetical protein
MNANVSRDFTISTSVQMKPICSGRFECAADFHVNTELAPLIWIAPVPFGIPHLSLQPGYKGARSCGGRASLLRGILDY